VAKWASVLLDRLTPDHGRVGRTIVCRPRETQ